MSTTSNESDRESEQPGGAQRKPRPTANSIPNDPFSGQMDRRSLLAAIPVTVAAGMIGLAVESAQPEMASALGTPKAAPAGTTVVVLGGNGFVGSKVCEVLVQTGEMYDDGDEDICWTAAQEATEVLIHAIHTKIALW